MVGKVQKGTGGPPFLSHEQQRSFRGEQQQSGGRPVFCRVNQVMEPLPQGPIAHLVMILQAKNVLIFLQPASIPPTRIAAASRMCAGSCPALTNRMRQGTGRTPIAPVVAVSLVRKKAMCLVVKIVGPDSVQSEAAFLNRPT